MRLLLFLTGIFASLLACAVNNPRAVEGSTYSISAATVIMDITLDGWGIIVGIVISILSFVLHCYVQFKKLNSERRDRPN